MHMRGSSGESVPFDDRAYVLLRPRMRASHRGYLPCYDYAVVIVKRDFTRVFAGGPAEPDDVPMELDTLAIEALSERLDLEELRRAAAARQHRAQPPSPASIGV